MKIQNYINITYPGNTANFILCPESPVDHFVLWNGKNYRQYVLFKITSIPSPFKTHRKLNCLAVVEEAVDKGCKWPVACSRLAGNPFQEFWTSVSLSTKFQRKIFARPPRVSAERLSRGAGWLNTHKERLFSLRGEVRNSSVKERDASCVGRLHPVVSKISFVEGKKENFFLRITMP